LLKVLDNPQRDIELAAVLRSPFFNISDTELVKIKIHSETNEHNENFYNCVVEYCNSGRDVKLAGRLKEILAAIEQWRTLARRGNLADLIWQVYRRTGFLSFVSALPNGQARRANLLKLHDRAIQFEGFASSAGIPSLTRFVEFIEKLQEAGEDWAPAEPESAAGNAVRILSVHKSKGLEFPVVFLAELDSKFNKRDIQRDFLADAGDTLGLQIIDRKSNSKLRSLAHEVIAERKLSTALAEEMRILYVATTRARDRLILTACEKSNNCRTTICNGFFFGAESIPSWQLRWCRSPLDWVLYGLSDQKNLHNAFETNLAASADDNLFSFRFYDQAELKQLSEFVIGLKTRKYSQPTRTKSSREIINNQLSIINELLAWRYEFGDAPLLPAKTSVTAITHRNDEYLKIDYSRALERKPKTVLSADLAGVVESRLIGTATHLVISQLDWVRHRRITKEAIEKVIDKLLADGAITEAVAEHIDTDSIMTFFESELGRITFDTGNSVWREWLFTFAMPASGWKLDGLDKPQHDIRNTQYAIRDTIIVQGIIDVLVKTPDGLLVIDFKTDRITAEEVSERAELYRRQLELYSKAAESILKVKLLGKWLYFLTPGCEVEIKN
jgi:ATP-dependent helicase/nuclease subunit A